jgi:hypothetical protein
MTWPKVKIKASQDTRLLNAACELFDIKTGFTWDGESDLSKLAEQAAIRGWADISKAFMLHDGKQKP